MGDSITASTGLPSYPFLLRTNFPGWRNASYFTNIALPGDTFSIQTNKFFTTSNVFATLPQNPTGGTNVIISLFTGATDLTSTWQNDVNAKSNFVVLCQSYGWKVALWTILPRGIWLVNSAGDNTGGMSKARYLVNTWALNSTNIDYVIDGASVIPDCGDPIYYYDANDALPDGQVHPSSFAHVLLAREFDKTLRLPSGWKRQALEHYREGPFWVWRGQKDGTFANAISTNGTIVSVRGGTLTNTIASQVGGAFGAGNTTNPALQAQAAQTQTTGPVFKVTQSDGSTTLFRVNADGAVAGAGGSSALSGFATIAANTASTGDTMFQLSNIAAAGHVYYIGSRSDGSFRIKDNTASLDRLTIDANGQSWLRYLLETGTAKTLSATTNGVYLLNVDAQTVTLPTAVGAAGQTYTIKAIAPCTTGTVATTSSQLIDGATTYGLSASNKFVRVISDNARWWIIGNN